MRFPWQKRKVEQPTDFPLKLNTDNLNWCRDARLLLIEGNGTLKRESRGRNEDWSQQYALTLRGTPLIVHNAPECPTCAGLLATGYGLDKADAPELQQISVYKSFFLEVLKLLAFQGIWMFLCSQFPLFFPLPGKNKGKSYCTLSSSFAASRLASLLACA